MNKIGLLLVGRRNGAQGRRERRRGCTAVLCSGLSGLALLLVGCSQTAEQIAPPAEEFTPASLQVLNGQALFLVACAGCHRFQPGDIHDVGPNLFGIADGPAAAAPGYRYSAALEQAGLSWDRANLAAWIAATEILVPGTTMTYANILSGSEVALVVDYLFDHRFNPPGDPDDD